MLRTLLVTTLTLITLGGLCAPSIPDALPADSFLVIGTPNSTALREGFDRSPASALWEEPSIQAFFRPLTEMITGFMEDQGGDWLIDKEELFDLFPGQIYVGLLDIRMTNGVPDITPFFAAETDRPQRALEILDTMIEASGATQSRDTERVRDITVARNTLRFTDSATLPGEVGTAPGLDLATAERSVTLRTAVVDGLFLLSVDEPMETVINNLRGGGDGGMTESESLQAARSLAGDPEHSLIFHVDPGALDRLITENIPASESFNPAALGLSDFLAMTTWINFGADSADSWFALPVRPNPRGLGRLVRHGGTSTFPALDWVPGDVARLSAMSYDLNGAWQDLRSILVSASPQMGFMLSGMMMSASQMLGFDPERDLLGSLGSDIVSYSLVNDEPSGMSPTTDVFLLSLSNPQGLETVLTRLAQPAVVGANQVSGAGALEAHEYLGMTYYSPPSVFEGQSAGVPGVAVVGDQLVFSTSVEELQRVLTASQGEIVSGIRESEMWQELEAVRLEGATGISCQDDAAVMAASMAMLQQMGLIMMMNPEVSLPFDFMSVPDPEVFERHMTHTVTSTRIDSRGIFSRGHTPHGD